MGWIMEQDAELELWKSTYRNWGLTSRFIPLAILRRRLLAHFPDADVEQVMRRIAERMQALEKAHSARQSSTWR
jgi:hypothetical protein